MNNDTENRNNMKVSQEEIAKQYQFIQQIKEINRIGLKKYTINTFGCQMNENDSERLAGMLSEMGYIQTGDVNESGFIIYNTCCVRENAELKVYGRLGALKKLKKDNPGMIIAVCGCMMQQAEVVEHIKRKYRHVDIVFGTHNLYKFPELVYRHMIEKETIIEVQDIHGSVAEDIPILRNDPVKSFVTVMYGCDNFCSYCIVPYVRGRERSRSPVDIVREVEVLGKSGCKEITLLGQNVNSYGKDLGSSFPQLLIKINAIDGIERIRFMTSHPKDLSNDLIFAIRDLKKVCEHIHLPIQSGSSRILQEMNRKYTKEEYSSLVEIIRNHIPGISVTTDIIVGFPGETDEDFEESIDTLEKIRFDFAYTFIYSKRTGTPASRMESQISDDIKKLRFNRLLEVQNRISLEANNQLMDTSVEILVEGHSKNSLSRMTGRTRTNKIVNFKGTGDLIGKLVNVKITDVKTWSFEGVFISSSERNL